MKKQLIGIFRLAVVLVIFLTCNVPSTALDIRMSLSDLIHGGHTEELRNSLPVTFVLIILTGALSFYIIQSLMYIFVGKALEGKNTGILRFLKYTVSGIREAAAESGNGNTKGGNLSNIDRVLSYRDNKMAFMSNSQAAEYMSGTGHVDFMLSNPNLPKSQETLSYLNNKIALMDNETALKFLKGNK